MVDRQKALIDFVTAWADYERRMNMVALEAQRAAEHDPALHRMIARITGDLLSSPEEQREVAKQLALAELSNAA